MAASGQTGEISAVVERVRRATFSTAWLDGFEDLAATKTACADPNTFRLTVYQCPDWLEVRLEGPLGLVIRVTDVMTGLAAFATEIACICHWDTPSSKLFESMQFEEYSERITGLFILTSRCDAMGRYRTGMFGLRKGA